MPWKKFVLFNFLGAATWVSAIALAGYFFGRHWHTLVRSVEEIDILITVIVGVVIFVIWRAGRSQTPAT